MSILLLLVMMQLPQDSWTGQLNPPMFVDTLLGYQWCYGQSIKPGPDGYLVSGERVYTTQTYFTSPNKHFRDAVDCGDYRLTGDTIFRPNLVIEFKGRKWKICMEGMP